MRQAYLAYGTVARHNTLENESGVLACRAGGVFLGGRWEMQVIIEPSTIEY